MAKAKYIHETDLSFSVREAFDIEWTGLAPKTAGISSVYENACNISEAKKRFEKDVPAQEAWCWAQRGLEGSQVQAAYDQVVREDAEFVEAWDARQL
jgi:hypothetical protein